MDLHPRRFSESELFESDDDDHVECGCGDKKVEYEKQWTSQAHSFPTASGYRTS